MAAFRFKPETIATLEEIAWMFEDAASQIRFVQGKMKANALESVWVHGMVNARRSAEMAGLFVAELAKCYDEEIKETKFGKFASGKRGDARRAAKEDAAKTAEPAKDGAKKKRPKT